MRGVSSKASVGAGTVAGTGAVAQLKPVLRRFGRRVLRQLGEVAVHALRVFGVDASEARSRLSDDEQPKAVVEDAPPLG